MGCIFAELLGRKPLFPGKDYVHQLSLITKVGTRQGGGDPSMQHGGGVLRRGAALPTAMCVAPCAYACACAAGRAQQDVRGCHCVAQAARTHLPRSPLPAVGTAHRRLLT